MLSGGSALSEDRIRLMESRRYDSFCELVFGGADEKLVAIIPPSIYKHLSYDVARERLVPELRCHESAANPTTSFYFWNRTRRFDSTNPYGMLLDIPSVYAPFLDRELVDMLLSLPSSMVASGKLHDDVIFAQFPEYAHIPFERKFRDNTNLPRSIRSTTNELIMLFASGGPSHLVRSKFVLPRLGARYLSFGHGDAGNWWLPLVVFLKLLDSVAFQGAIRPMSDTTWVRVGGGEG